MGSLANRLAIDGRCQRFGQSQLGFCPALQIPDVRSKRIHFAPRHGHGGKHSGATPDRRSRFGPVGLLAGGQGRDQSPGEVSIPLDDLRRKLDLFLIEFRRCGRSFGGLVEQGLGGFLRLRYSSATIAREIAKLRFRALAHPPEQALLPYRIP